MQAFVAENHRELRINFRGRDSAIEAVKDVPLQLFAIVMPRDHDLGSLDVRVVQDMRDGTYHLRPVEYRLSEIKIEPRLAHQWYNDFFPKNRFGDNSLGGWMLNLEGSQLWVYKRPNYMMDSAEDYMSRRGIKLTTYQ